MAIVYSSNIIAGVPLPLDGYYYNDIIPYTTTASVCSSITFSSRYIGMTVLIGTSSTRPYPQEYWWQNGTSDSQLVLKQSLATGNITGSASTGYVALWTGTTSVGYSPSLYWNSGINGLLVGSAFSSGTYSLQVYGDAYFRSNATNSIGINISHGSPSNSGVAIYSNTYKSAFGFFNLTAQSFIRGSVAGGGTLLSIEDTNSDGNGINPLTITSKPPTGDGFTSSFNFLTFGVFPEFGTIANGASINQQYYYRDYPTYSASSSNPNAYRQLGLYGMIYESGTFSFENTSFRWKLSNNGSVRDYMKLNTDGLMIRSTVSRGTYSLQVNGSTIISGTSNSGGTIVPSFVGSAALVLDGNSACGIYSALSSGFQFFNQSSGCIINGDAQTLLDIQHRSNNPGKYGLMLRSFPVNNTSGSVGNYNLLTFLSSPSPSASSMFLTGSSLGQSYNAFDPNTLTYSYMGNFGCYMDSNTFNSISTSFRWSTSNAGSFSNNMILRGYGVGKSQLLIGYGTSQGTYSLQVNGNAYFSENISASGSITAQTGGFDSDFRLKSDIVYNPIIKGIDSIKSASYVIGGNSHIGYIAQDVEGIVPSSIIIKEDGYLALNYNEVLVAKVAYLENKVKELYDIIERNGLK
jgi:hypothetical protein